MTIPEFAFGYETCPKCGNFGPRGYVRAELQARALDTFPPSGMPNALKYHANGSYCGDRASETEHLHYSCTMCTYTWTTATRDAEVPVVKSAA